MTNQSNTSRGLTERQVLDITKRVARACAKIARECGPEIRQGDGTTILGDADAEFIARTIEKDFRLTAGRAALQEQKP